MSGPRGSTPLEVESGLGGCAAARARAAAGPTEPKI
jgi:hypothetical protein